MLPLVSFVIPVEDDAERLRQCLGCIRRSRYPADLIELVVVIDRGAHQDVVAGVAREHGGFVVRSSGSISEKRNRGARAALGGILVFAPATWDCDRQWIRKALRVLSDGPAGWVAGPSFAVRRAPFEASGGFDASVRQEVDDLCDRLRRAGHRIVTDSPASIAA